MVDLLITSHLYHVEYSKIRGHMAGLQCDAIKNKNRKRLINEFKKLGYNFFILKKNDTSNRSLVPSSLVSIHN